METEEALVCVRWILLLGCQRSWTLVLFCLGSSFLSDVSHFFVVGLFLSHIALNRIEMAIWT